MKKWKVCLTNKDEIEVLAKIEDFLITEMEYVPAQLVIKNRIEDILIKRKSILWFKELPLQQSSYDCNKLTDNIMIEC